MAITALATQNTTIGPAQFADMIAPLKVGFKVDSPNDLKPSFSGHTVTITAGSGNAGGTRIKATTSHSVTVPSVSSGQMWHAICLRIDWSSSDVDLVAIKGTSSSIPINKTTTANTSSMNRIPGVLYDAMIAHVLVKPGGISSLADSRMHGGEGGPYIVSDAMINGPSTLDVKPGTWIATDQAKITKRKDVDGSWRTVQAESNPWKTWTPTVRYHGMSATDIGVGSGTLATLGTGGKASGRYRVVDGLLDGFVSIETGPNYRFGTGAITFDLPMQCVEWQPDVWINGHIWMASGTTGGSTSYDFPAQCLIKAGWTQAQIFAPQKAEVSNQQPHLASKTGAKGEGVPLISNGLSVGSLYVFHVSYPVED